MNLPIYHRLIIMAALLALAVTLKFKGRIHSAFTLLLAVLLLCILPACSSRPPTAPDPFQDVPWDQPPSPISHLQSPTSTPEASLCI